MPKQSSPYFEYLEKQGKLPKLVENEPEPELEDIDALDEPEEDPEPPLSASVSENRSEFAQALRRSF